MLLATGSEVQLAVEAKALLAADGVVARVVSLPSWFMFAKQDWTWTSEVLPDGVPRVAVEAGVTPLWRSLVGLLGGVVGIDTFGESAPAADLVEHFQMTAEHVAAEALATIRRCIESDIKGRRAAAEGHA